METLAGPAGAILLLVLMGLCLFGTVFGLPGTGIAFLLALLFGWLTGFAALTGRLLLWLGILALVAEAADQVLGIWAARRYGASVKGIFGSIIGGIVGAVVLGSVFPIIGGIIGAFAGAYAGALLVERQVSGDWTIARRAAWGNFLGRAAGTMLKLVAGAAMMILVGQALF